MKRVVDCVVVAVVVTVSVLLTRSAGAAAREIAIPAEVVVSSHATVQGSERNGRVISGARQPVEGSLTVGRDGVPVVHGVRVHETDAERSEPVWRNARVIGGQLFPNTGDSVGASPFSLEASSEHGARVAKTLRQGRILSNSEQEEENIPLHQRLSKSPPHYYRKYFQKKNNKTAKDTSFSPMVGITVLDKPSVSNGIDELTKSSSTIGAVSSTKTEPVYKAYSDARLSTQAKPTYTKPSVAYKESASLTIPASVSTIKDSRKHFKHRVQQIQPNSNFRFPTESSQYDGQILSPGSYQLPSAAAQFQDSVDPFSGRPVNPNQFKIKQMAFQSVPGGPIVNIPVPIPHGGQKKPDRKFSLMETLGLNGLFGGNRREGQLDSQPGTYISSGSSQLEGEYESPSLFDTITDPIRRLGETVLDLIRPLRSPALLLSDSSTYQQQQQLDNKQGTVADPAEALVVGSVVAGAGVLAGIGALLYANTVTNDTHYIIGRRRRRSISSNDQEELIESILERLDSSEQSFLGVVREQGLDKWTSKECAKRIYCNFLMDRDPQLRQVLSDRVTSFLSYLDDGSSGGLMDQARVMHQSIASGSCDRFLCPQHPPASEERTARSRAVPQPK